MANRSQTGAAGAPETVSVGVNIAGSPSAPACGGVPLDVDWHGAAAAIASRHWRRTLGLVAVLMVIGFVVTFVPQFWAREWASLRFAGWPLPFYMGAQGSILIDIGLIVIYVWLQRRNDARYQRELHELRDAHRNSLGPDGAALSRDAAPATSLRPSSRATSAPASR
ncbi:DUF4212 domain-containing protein [Pandoraea apista]|uniref:Sodium symporter small subunit domain-containing protein n=1 Tax=Pandoraea apista TaxID=93218 RepID=A0A5E5PE91_9BURK|nr:DUF4212 domain-containing protein [Pandoraea apista]OXS96814.1 hypothetical protein B7H01_03965 [Pandoraea apista]VVG73949.1 hypothetical protein PAP18089_04960 [Pandoraea apista]